MSFDPEGLNNIAGSLGGPNLWIYTTDTDTVTVVRDDNYFTPAVDFGIQSLDYIITRASDGMNVGKLLFTYTPSLVISFEHTIGW